jgi:hypothetical protein
MRSSDLMGGEVFTYYVLLPFIADQQRAGMSASSARPMGGTDINYFFSFLINSPAHRAHNREACFMADPVHAVVMRFLSKRNNGE